jgi:hypothetical protein
MALKINVKGAGWILGSGIDRVMGSCKHGRQLRLNAGYLLSWGSSKQPNTFDKLGVKFEALFLSKLDQEKDATVRHII